MNFFGSLFHDHLLTLITFLPLATGIFLLLLHGIPVLAWRIYALLSTTLTFVLSVFLFCNFDAKASGYQFVEHLPWLPDWGINYFVGIDGISLLLIALTTFIMPLALIASWTSIKQAERTYIFCMLFLETGMLGAFVSLNLFQFYVFWEVMLIPMYLIIGIWGGPRRIYASVKFFLFTMLGSLLMLVALLVVCYLNYQEFQALNLDLVALDPTLFPASKPGALLQTTIPPLLQAGQALHWWQTPTWLFAAFALAFAIKVPMVPLHTWLPDAHVEAPTAGSVILAAVLLKMGTYGFLRFAIPLFPSAAIEFAPLFMTLALIGILYGALIAMVQTDVKKLVAYSSVAHLGFVMLGMFAFNIEGLQGSILQMVNHGISTGALFLAVGMIYERRHTREIADFGGLAKPMPAFAFLFLVATMASIGLPMLNGFVGEFLILLGTWKEAPAFAAPATFGVVLAACYMLWMFRRVVFGPVTQAENRTLTDLDWREKFVLVVVLLPAFWIGIYPKPFLNPLLRPVSEIVMRIDAAKNVQIPSVTDDVSSTQKRVESIAEPLRVEAPAAQEALQELPSESNLSSDAAPLTPESEEIQ